VELIAAVQMSLNDESLIIPESAHAISPEEVALPPRKETDYPETSGKECRVVGLQEWRYMKSACGYNTTETTGLRRNRQPACAAEENILKTRRQ
jgi:hypothetical protein